MVHLDAQEVQQLHSARQRARSAGRVQRVQLMLLAAGMAAFAIVAVAAAMMTTLL